MRRVSDWLDEPVPILRLELVRILAPLAVLGFMSTRLAHADEWIGNAGFRVPDLGGDYRQPLFVPPLPVFAAWTVAAIMVTSGLACACGWMSRASAGVFAVTLAFVAVSDRLAAFTVSKLSTVVMMAVALGPSGSRLGFDAWRNAKRGGAPSERNVVAPSVRFLQLLPITIYSASGIAKARGDWLSNPLVLWTHLHDSYQTQFSFALASSLPGWTWTAFQGAVLIFEIFAPLWFSVARTRGPALLFGLGMHAMIGLMFGPVLWFALLMMTLLLAAYVPERFLAPLDDLAGRLESASNTPHSVASEATSTRRRHS